MIPKSWSANQETSLNSKIDNHYYCAYRLNFRVPKNFLNPTMICKSLSFLFLGITYNCPLEIFWEHKSCSSQENSLNSSMVNNNYCAYCLNLGAPKNFPTLTMIGQLLSFYFVNNLQMSSSTIDMAHGLQIQDVPSSL